MAMTSPGFQASLVVGLVTRSATKRRAGIDVISSSSDPWRAIMIITLIYGQLGGPGWSWQCMCLYSKTLGGYELVVHSIYYK